MLERLSIAFGAGIKLPSLWLVALGSILRTLENKNWAGRSLAECLDAAEGSVLAGPDRSVGRLLHYFGGQIMQHVILKEGHKLALTADAPVAEGLAQSIATAEFCEHHPLEGTVTAAAALIRWGAPTAAPVEHYTNCVMARAHRCIPQVIHFSISPVAVLRHCCICRNSLHGSKQAATSLLSTLQTCPIPVSSNICNQLHFLTKLCFIVTLWEAIFAVRASPDGSVVPVAGTHSTVTSWEGVLCLKSRAVLDRYNSVCS